MHEATHVYGTTSLVRYSFQHFLDLSQLFRRARQIFGTFLLCSVRRHRPLQAIVRNAPTVTEQAGPLQPGVDGRCFRFGLTKQCPETKKSKKKKSIKYLVWTYYS